MAQKEKRKERNVGKIMYHHRPRLLPSLLALCLWTMWTTLHLRLRTSHLLACLHQLRWMALQPSQLVDLKSRRSSHWPAIRHSG